MQSVKVDKTKLVEALTTNKATHVQQYEEALEGYYKAAAAEVKALAKRVANRTEDGDLYIGLQKPVSYEDSYDTALEMLSWEQADTVTLSQAEFKQYIQDSWAWKQSFSDTTMSYSH